MNKKTKKGFTIVELVIVIAVIAILAAVLIPTFSNVIQKAKISKDTQLIRNLNTALAVDGKQHNTMHEAIIAAEAFGYNLEKIDASATDNKILWDSKNDVFCYLVKDGETTKVQYIPDTMLKVKEINEGNDYVEGKVNKVDYWMIANRLDVEPQYSIYAGPEFSDPNHILNNLKEGFDAGSRTDIIAINYTGGLSAQSVVIRTNGGDLTINAANDNVAHFGEANNVNVIAVKPASYHEHGNVIGTVSVQSGHVQVEAGATVASIVAEVKAADNTATAIATVTATNGATVGTVVVNVNTAEIKVEAGATVAAVAPGKDVTLVPEKVTGTTPSTTPIDTTQASNFAGGLGTEASPYLIATGEQFSNISRLTGKMKSGEFYYFKQINDITISRGVGGVFTGLYEGDNHSIKLSKNLSGVCSVFGMSRYDVVVKNLNLYTTQTAAPTLVAYAATGVMGDWLFGNASFENVNFYNNEEGICRINEANFGFYSTGAIYQYGKTEHIMVELINCTNNASIMNEARSAAFVGSFDGADDGGNAKLVINNCINNGDIIVTGISDGWASLICANTYSQYFNQYNLNPEEYVIIENVKNYGRIIGASSSKLFDKNSVLNETYSSLNVGDRSLFSVSQGKMDSLQFTIAFNGTNIVIDDGVAENGYQYSIAFNLPSIYEYDGHYDSRSTSIILENTNEQLSENIYGAYIVLSSSFDKTNAIKVGTCIVVGYVSEVYVKDNYIYISVPRVSGVGGSGNEQAQITNIAIVAYDENGAYVGTKKISFAAAE